MFSSSKPKFDANKCKVQLKMLINRLNLLTQKKANLAKAEKRKVAMLLRDDKEHNARILVEQIIRDDYLLESYDLIKQYTEMLIGRFNVLVSESELKIEVAGAVCALVYAGWLMGTEISELKELFNLFTAKYGKAYTQEVLDNKEKYINARLLKILSSTQVPDPTVIDAYLAEIAKAYGVEFIPKPGSSTHPVSATLGIALPTPGMPMPATADLVDLSDVGGASASDPSLPTPLLPVASSTPVPGVAAHPAPDAGGGGGSRISIGLTKDTTQGFGLSLDAASIVTGVKAGSQAEFSGRIRVGDRVISIDDKAVTAETPAKSIAADVEVGRQAAFTFLRVASPPASTAGGTSTSAVQMPTQGATAPVAATPASVYPTAELIVPPTMGAPAIAAPPGPPPPGPIPAADPDDLLAKRLEALKRG